MQHFDKLNNLVSEANDKSKPKNVEFEQGEVTSNTQNTVLINAESPQKSLKRVPVNLQDTNNDFEAYVKNAKAILKKR